MNPLCVLDVTLPRMAPSMIQEQNQKGLEESVANFFNGTSQNNGTFMLLILFLLYTSYISASFGFDFDFMPCFSFLTKWEFKAFSLFNYTLLEDCF